MNPIIICYRKWFHQCLIEGSCNSIRISFRINGDDEISQILIRKFMRIVHNRAESLEILRRKPISGYDITFLLTLSHLQQMNHELLIDSILNFIKTSTELLVNQPFSYDSFPIFVKMRGRLLARKAIFAGTFILTDRK